MGFKARKQTRLITRLEISSGSNLLSVRVIHGLRAGSVCDREKGEVFRCPNCLRLCCWCVSCGDLCDDCALATDMPG